MNFAYRCPYCHTPFPLDRDPSLTIWPIHLCPRCGASVIFCSRAPDQFDWSISPDEFLDDGRADEGQS